MQNVLATINLCHCGVDPLGLRGTAQGAAFTQDDGRRSNAGDERRTGALDRRTGGLSAAFGGGGSASSVTSSSACAERVSIDAAVEESDFRGGTWGG